MDQPRVSTTMATRPRSDQSSLWCCIDIAFALKLHYFGAILCSNQLCTNVEALATAQGKPKRLSVTLSEPIYRVLETLATEKGVSIADILRDAIALEKWLVDTERQGGKLLIERDGQVRELVRV